MKNRFTGIMNVFKFAYIQSVKAKTFIVVMTILCGVALFALPVVTGVTRLGKDDTDGTKTELIGSIYVCDQTFDGKIAKNMVDIIKKNPEYSEKNCIVVSAEDYDKTFDAVKKSKDGDVLVNIEYCNDAESLDYGFSYVVFYGEEVKKLDEASDELAKYIDDIHNEVLAKTFALTEAGVQLLSYDFSVEATMLDEDGNVVEEEVLLDQMQYWISYAFLMVSIVSFSILATKVSENIVTEKSSKVIEYIMTSIKPMALVTGKVLASVAIMFTMLAGIIVSFIGSIFINGILFREADGSMMLPGFVKTLIEENAFKGVSVVSVVASMLVLALGFMLYGFLAGIAGATVSKVEEMAEGLKIFTFAMIIGAYLVLGYLASATGGADWGALKYVVYLFPLCSPFIVPAYLFIGKMSIVIGLLSSIILIVMIVLLMYFVSGVYEYLIYYNGSPMKLKELIKIFKRKGAK